MYKMMERKCKETGYTLESLGVGEVRASAQTLPSGHYSACQVEKMAQAEYDQDCLGIEAKRMDKKHFFQVFIHALFLDMNPTYG